MKGKNFKMLSKTEQMRNLEDSQHTHLTKQGNIESKNQQTLVVMKQLTRYEDFYEKEINHIAILSSN